MSIPVCNFLGCSYSVSISVHILGIILLYFQQKNRLHVNFEFGARMGNICRVPCLTQLSQTLVTVPTQSRSQVWWVWCEMWLSFAGRCSARAQLSREGSLLTDRADYSAQPILICSCFRNEFLFKMLVNHNWNI